VIYKFIANSQHLYLTNISLQEDYDCFKRQKVQMVIAIKSIGISKLDAFPYLQDTSIFLGSDLPTPVQMQGRRSLAKFEIRG